MGAQEDLLASFGTLANGIRDLAIGNSVKKAQDKVDELNKDSTLSQFERIRQQQAIAKSVSTGIVGMGGSASAAQTAMMSLSPEIPDARLAALEATGKGSIEEATKALQEEEEKRTFEKEKRAYQRQKMLQDDQQESAERIAGMRTEGKAAAKPISAPLTNKLAQLVEMKETLTRLKGEFAARGGAIGPIAGGVPDLAYGVADKLTFGATGGSDAVAYRTKVKDFFNQYRKDITGAAASVPELKALAGALPTENDLDNNFEAKIEEQINGVDTALKTRLRVLKSQGKDVSAFEEEFGIEVSAPKVQGDAREGSTSPAAPVGLGKYITFKN
jgi:hypothetical protein